MIHFNYKNHKYTIVSWYSNIRMMEIKKDTGSIVRTIIYSPFLTVKDFLSRLEKVNFYENI